MQSPFIQYKVRPGTIDLGKEYESKILSLLSLQCLHHNQEDFWFAFNAYGVGDFDDIILRHGENTFMLQVKHKENPKLITEAEFLAQPTKDFSLKRYLQHIHDLKATLDSTKKEINNLNSLNSGIVTNLESSDKIYFLLYTNRDVNQCSFLNKIPENDNKNLSYLSSKDNSGIFKFDLSKLPSDLNVSSHNYTINLYLYANQIYAKDVDKRIEEEIKKIIKVNDAKTVSESFIKFIAEWGKGNLGGHYCLTRQDIVLKLTELLFNPYEVKLLLESYNFHECERKLLWNKIIKDKIITFVDINSEYEMVLDFLLKCVGSVVKNYCNVTKTENWSYNLSQKYQSLFYIHNADLKLSMLKIIGNRGKITLNDIYKCLWYSNKLPLLLEINKKDQYKHIIDILKLSNYSYKIIIINRGSESFIVNDSVNYFKNLQDLKEQCRMDILEQKIKLQERSSMELKYFIDETMFMLVKTIDIINILDDNFSVGKELVCVPKYYIQRKLTRTYIKFKALTEISKEIFLIDDTTNHFQTIAEKENLKVNHLNEIDFENLDEYRIVINNNQQKEKLEKLFSSKRVVHYLVFYNPDNIEWKNSYGSIKNIKDYQTEFGNILESNIDFSSKYVNIISAAPGMGKSMLMDHIAQEAPANKWVLRIDLNKHQDYYEGDRCKFKETESSEHLQYFKDPLQKDLDEKIFEKLLKNKNIIVLLDGFDEISISYKEEVINIANSLVNDGFLIWLTTRPLMKSYLEEKFNTIALNLIPFSEDNQKEFLIKYFSEDNSESLTDSKEFLHTFIEKLLKAFKRNINDRDANFTGTPLHVKLLAEAFSDECETYLFNKGTKGFNENFDLLDLYRKFIKKKIKILCDKFGVGSKDLHFFYKDYQSLYALKLLFPLHRSIIDEYLNEFNKYKKDNIQLLQKEGVLTVDEQNNIYFVHRTFAEYLAAEWLSENFNNKNEDIKYLAKILIAERFTQSYQFLFNVFDRLLVKGCKLHLIIMNGQVNDAYKMINECSNNITATDRAKRTALHLLALYVVQYPLLLNICSLVIEKTYSEMPTIENDLLGYNPIDYSLTNRSLNIANLMCEKWKNTEINIHLDKKLQGRYLNCALSDYKYLFNTLLINFIYKDVILKNVDKDETVGSYLRKYNFGNYKQLKMYENTKISGILNVDQFIHNPNIYHEIAFGHKENVQKLLGDAKRINERDFNGDTFLHYAVLHRKLEIIELLLLNNASVNLKNLHNETPLHCGVRCGYSDVVERLISCKADINAKNQDGNTPLHTAILNGNGKMAELLINRGADLNTSNNDRNTCLHLLIKENFNDMLEELLSKGVFNDKKNFSNETPLHLSLHKRKLNAAKMFILNGADVNTKDRYGESIINSAVNTNNVEIVEQIFSKGASISYEDMSLIHKAVENNNMEMMKLLLCNGCDINAKHQNGKTVLHFAAEFSEENFIKAILDYGAVINKCDRDRNTPLHLAVRLQRKYSQKRSTLKYRHLLKKAREHTLIEMDSTEIAFEYQKRISIAKLLISNGADVNAINYEGKTPIHYIFENELTEIIFAILDNKLKTLYEINFNIKDELGNTILYDVIRKNDFDCIKKIMLKTKIMINQQNNESDTLLHLASELGQLDTVKLLCQNDADVTLKNKRGCTALCMAVSKKHLIILEEFLKLDNIIENINEVDADGKTVVHKAVENNFKEGLIVILEHGGDIDRCDNNGDTALHLAVKNNLIEIVKILFHHFPDIDIWNCNKKTAQSLAYEMGNEEIIYLFQKYCIRLFQVTNP